MDITVVRTQKTFYQVDSTLAAMLLEAFPSDFERVEKPAPPRITEPEWGVGQTFGFVCITLRLPNGEVRTYDGPPDEAANGFKYRQWSGEKQAYVIDGPVPPAGILVFYKLQYKPRPR